LQSDYLRRGRGRMRTVIDALLSVPLGIPGIILGLGFLILFIKTPLYGTLWIILIAYVARFFPFATRGVSALYLSINPELEQSARASGGSWAQTMRWIVLPLLRPAIIAAWPFRACRRAPINSTSRAANIKVLFPKEGVVILPQATFILQDAPHPAAAKLWIDFILSEAGQSILVDNEALISGREGFKSPHPDYAPAIGDLNVIKVDWSKVSTDDMGAARSDWVNIFNP
jgi:hypothetical protein